MNMYVCMYVCRVGDWPVEGPITRSTVEQLEQHKEVNKQSDCTQEHVCTKGTGNVNKPSDYGTERLKNTSALHERHLKTV
jgi:hypothetical protein